MAKPSPTLIIKDGLRIRRMRDPKLIAEWQQLMLTTLRVDPDKDATITFHMEGGKVAEIEVVADSASGGNPRQP